MTDPDRGLEEVERALSVLGGRHPEKVRAEREAAEAAERRRQEHALLAAKERRRRVKRGLAFAGVGLVVAVGVWRVLAFQSARSEADAEFAPLEKPYATLGFVTLPRGTFATPHRIELQTTEGSCYVFVATGHAALKIERATGKAASPNDAFLCTCGSENLVVSTSPGAAVRALQTSGAAFGGARALPYRFAIKAPTLVAGSEACDGEMLEAFARDHHSDAPMNDAWLGAHPSLSVAGFVSVANVPARLPFAFTNAGAGRCFIAASSDARDTLTLWAPPGQKPLENKRGPVAWCDVKGAPFIIERAGAGELSVASVASRRIGGLLGLREQLGLAAVAPAAVWLRDDERGELTADALRASVVPDPAVVVGQAIDAAQADARVVAFSVGGVGSFVPDSLASAAFRCAPELSDTNPETLCVQTRAQTWRPPSAEIASAAAFGPLPFWMSALQTVKDVDLVGTELALITLARRLASRGFAPTIIEGVTEKDSGVEVLGRSGEDAVVVLGLWPAAPWVVPYTDGPAWSIDGEPRVLALGSGERLTLSLEHATSLSRDKRRTIVFRRAIVTK